MMLRWGWGMLIGSSAAFILGIWSIAIGPFIDTSGIPVSYTMTVRKRRERDTDADLARSRC